MKKKNWHYDVENEIKQMHLSTMKKKNMQARGGN